MSRLNRPDDAAVPLRRPDVEWIELDGEAVVHDPRTGSLHRLNASAASVWAASDGSSTVDDIVGAMRETYAGHDNAIAHDVHEALTQLRREGLLDVSRGDQSPTESSAPSTGNSSAGGGRPGSPAD